MPDALHRQDEYHYRNESDWCSEREFRPMKPDALHQQDEYHYRNESDWVSATETDSPESAILALPGGNRHYAQPDTFAVAVRV
jgi:hypothetical protein